MAMLTNLDLMRRVPLFARLTVAQAEVIVQQQAEGMVLAPVSGRVLEVPVARGAVLMPGEPVATLAGGWQSTWMVTVSGALLGTAAMLYLSRRLTA